MKCRLRTCAFSVGLEIWKSLEQAEVEGTRRMLDLLPRRQQRRLAKAMAVIEEVLSRDDLQNFLEQRKERYW